MRFPRLYPTVLIFFLPLKAVATGKGDDNSRLKHVRATLTITISDGTLCKSEPLCDTYVVDYDSDFDFDDEEEQDYAFPMEGKEEDGYVMPVDDDDEEDDEDDGVDKVSGPVPLTLNQLSLHIPPRYLRQLNDDRTSTLDSLDIESF